LRISPGKKLLFIQLILQNAGMEARKHWATYCLVMFGKLQQNKLR
jgi:hypothetical protein